MSDLTFESSLIGKIFESNNKYSDTITIEVRAQLSDGTYLVHKHTNCCKKYQHQHPDAFFVVSEEMLNC